MDKPKRIHQKSISLVLAFVLTLICVLTQNPVVFAADTGNEWVYDESNVISKDTEDYIKNLKKNIQGHWMHIKHITRNIMGE